MSVDHVHKSLFYAANAVSFDFQRKEAPESEKLNFLLWWHFRHLTSGGSYSRFFVSDLLRFAYTFRSLCNSAALLDQKNLRASCSQPTASVTLLFPDFVHDYSKNNLRAPWMLHWKIIEIYVALHAYSKYDGLHFWGNKCFGNLAFHRIAF